MSLPRKAILGILTDNLSMRRSVLPLSRKATTQWALGLNILRSGETHEVFGYISFMGLICIVIGFLVFAVGSMAFGPPHLH